MKQMKLLLSLSELDPALLAEADASRAARAPSPRLKKLLATAACLAAMLLLTLALFLPYSPSAPDLSAYRESEYYELLTAISGRHGGYRNGFDALFSGIISSFRPWNDVENIVNSSNSSTSGEGSSQGIDRGDSFSDDITDNQTDGISEADLIKRNGSTIFYVAGNWLTLFAYRAEAGEVTELDSLYLYNLLRQIDPLPYPADSYSINMCPQAMLLSEDGRTLTLLCTDYQNTLLLAFDVTDPSAMVLKTTYSVSGHYATSRLVGGKLILTTTQSLSQINADRPETYLAYHTDGKTTAMLAPEEILISDSERARCFITVSLLDASSLSLLDCKAIYADGYSDIYVSKHAVYLACDVNRVDYFLKSYSFLTAATEIYGFGYEGSAFTDLGHVTVDGEVLNQYSMDEYEGILRVATTTRESSCRISDAGTAISPSTRQTNASLWCVDLTSWEIIGKAEKFAPDGEEVKSARFDGTTAYICTAEMITFTDPVFFFDLSDPTALSSKDTGTIEGFSTSLIQLPGGDLLGIGRGNSSRSAKIEVWREGEIGVDSVCSYLLEGAVYSEDYKSYLIDREAGLFGFCYFDAYIDVDSEWDTHYLLLHYDGQKLTPLVHEALHVHGQTPYLTARAFVKDGTLYVFADMAAYAFPLDSAE